jgi:uncharacterized lipoprotein YmbA
MSNMIRIRPHLVTLVILMIAGCGSSPPVHYYGLDAMDIAYIQDNEGSPVLALGPFRMPEYLNRSQMVTRGSGAELIVDDVNRWAEPLDDAIHRILASNLDRMLGSVVVVAYPSSALLEIDYRLVGRIGRFNAGEDGLVVLEVQWGAADTDGNMLMAPTRSRYESQATVPGDPAAVVQAMSDALEQFSRDMASDIGALELEQIE